MERTEVYKLIDGERDYQEWRWTDSETPDEDKPPIEWLSYIRYHADRCEISNYELGKEAAMEEIRKIAALAVRAMEIHGCPARQIAEQE